MGVVFLVGYMGIDGDDEIDNSVVYLEGWLKVLKEDNKLIFKVVVDVQKVVNYILGY